MTALRLARLGLGLGPVTGDDFGHGPVVVAGDQHMLAEDFLFQGGTGFWVHGPGQAQIPGLVTIELPGDDTTGPGLVGDLLDLGFHLIPAAAGLAAGERGASSSSFVPALARVVPSNRQPGFGAAPGSASGSSGAGRRRRCGGGP